MNCNDCSVVSGQRFVLSVCHVTPIPHPKSFFRHGYPQKSAKACRWPGGWPFEDKSRGWRWWEKEGTKCPFATHLAAEGQAVQLEETAGTASGTASGTPSVRHHFAEDGLEYRWGRENRKVGQAGTLFLQAEAGAPFLSAGANRLWGFGASDRCCGFCAVLPALRPEVCSALGEPHWMLLCNFRFKILCWELVSDPIGPGLHKTHQADRVWLAKNFRMVPLGLVFVPSVAATTSAKFDKLRVGVVASTLDLARFGLAIRPKTRRSLDLAHFRLFGGCRLVAGHDLLPQSKCHATRG